MPHAQPSLLPPAPYPADELGREYAICDGECRALAAHLGRRPHLSEREAETYKTLLRRRARIADEWRRASEVDSARLAQQSRHPRPTLGENRDVEFPSFGRNPPATVGRG